MKRVKQFITISLIGTVIIGCDRLGNHMPDTPPKPIDSENPGEKDKDSSGTKNSCSGTSVNFTTIAKGEPMSSRIEKDQNLIISDQQTWSGLWQKIKGGNSQVPTVDFSKYRVIAVFKGKENTGGHYIRVDGICVQNNTYNVKITNTNPTEKCLITMAFTYPYHIVKVPKLKKSGFTKGKIRFNEKTVRECKRPGSKGGGDCPERLKFRELEGGAYSGVEQSNNLVIKDRQEFKRIWGQIHNNKVGNLPTLPQVNFQTNIVVGVFQGRKPTGGFSIGVDHICKSKGNAEIHVTKTRPGNKCFVTQALTAPYQLVVVPKVRGRVSFNTTVDVRNCE